jgi:hypothetical protein
MSIFPHKWLILVVIGILVIQAGLTQVTKPVSRWNFIGIRRGVDYFRGDFPIGSYKITVNQIDDGFIELFDTPRNLIERFDFDGTFEECFLISYFDEYHFYCRNYSSVSNLTVTFYLETIKDVTYRPFGGWEWVGGLVFLAGVSVYCYGISVRQPLKKFHNCQ